MEKYTVVGRIGEGAHGLVLKAYDTAAGRDVALKKVPLKRIEDGIPVSVIREVKTLQRLQHRYIAELLETFPVGLDFVMVFEYMPSGLWEMLRDFDEPLTVPRIKRYMMMLLDGVAYMHSEDIIHRDLKPANLLINSEGILKIADFGLARLMWADEGRPYTHQVATRWYRAPELLYGARFYSSAIDMWSVGCVLGEMLNNSPLFPGETDIEQLAIVLRLLGSPTPESWPELSTLPDYDKITFPYHSGVPWEQIVPDAHPEAVDLVQRMLVYDSSKRLTARQAMQHVYFLTKPYPCSEADLPKPPEDHRSRLKPKRIETNIKNTVLFENLLSLA